MREGRRAFGVFVRRVVGVWEWRGWKCVCVGRRVYERGGIAYASGGKGKENGVVWRAQMELVENVGILASVWAVLVYLV